MSKLRDDFKSMFFKLCREHDIAPGSPEMKEIIRDWDEWLHTSENIEENRFGRDFTLEDPEHKDLFKLHESIVQGCIDYINSHPKIQEEISKKKEELEKEWNEGYTGKYKLIPDVRVYFSVDGLEDSLEHGKWVAATDSSISVNVGNVSVIYSM